VWAARYIPRGKAARAQDARSPINRIAQQYADSDECDLAPLSTIPSRRPDVSLSAISDGSSSDSCSDSCSDSSSESRVRGRRQASSPRPVQARPPIRLQWWNGEIKGRSSLSRFSTTLHPLSLIMLTYRRSMPFSLVPST
jgi:hypothetical protein